jgi:CheY-like chemotaxis protein
MMSNDIFFDGVGRDPSASTPKQSDPTVLIVDDDEEIRHALRLLFEVEGFNVIGEASNGLEAIALAMTQGPRFIILDYKMPVMDGEQAAGLLRSVSPDCRIVAFSAVLDGKPEWADSYLSKDQIGEISPLLAGLLGTSRRGIGVSDR